MYANYKTNKNTSVIILVTSVKFFSATKLKRHKTGNSSVIDKAKKSLVNTDRNELFIAYTPLACFA